MPIFFIVGGFTNAGSWLSASRRGTTYADWLRARAARLMRPALVFVAFWTVPPMLAVAVGLPSGLARTGGEEVALPLWFLAIYLLTVTAAPALLTIHERYGGIRVLVVLAAATALVDAGRWGLGLPFIGGMNYAFVWLGILEIGFLWRAGVLTRRRWVPWAMAAGGVLTMAALTSLASYPVSMIGLTHAERSNTVPPSFALLALAVWQCGAMLIFEAMANRWLARARVWLVVVVANSMVMTLYLWNMTALVLAAVILFPTGLAPQPDVLSPAWWWLRPAWIVSCAVCLAPFLLAFRWAERPGELPRAARPGRIGLASTIGGVVVGSIGLALLAAVAFPVQGAVLAKPLLGVVCVAAGAIVLRVQPLSPLRGARESRE
jgi:hypothetical protein